uniref:Uncharacterized protein n=1 Tax=viral metagenome TaxID=1070528 RepID=A0A6C0KVB1_9ZZZZ
MEEYKIVISPNISSVELDEIATFVAQFGQAEREYIVDGLERAKSLGLLKIDNKLVSVGVLKNPNESYIKNTYTKAGVAIPNGTLYEYKYSGTMGKGYSSILKRLLSSLSENQSVFVTVRQSNAPRIYSLSKHNFVQVGHDYASENGDNLKLFQFTKEAVSFIIGNMDNIPKKVQDLMKEKSINRASLVLFAVESVRDEVNSIFAIIKVKPNEAATISSTYQYTLPEEKMVLCLKTLFIADGYENIEPVITKMLTSINTKLSIVFTLLAETSPYISQFNLLNFEHRGIRFKNEFEVNQLLMVYGLEQPMNEIKFGIEFEVCVCDNFEDDTLQTMSLKPVHISKKEELKYNFKTYTLMLEALARKYNLPNQFVSYTYREMLSMSPEELYKCYFATSDSSIICADLLDLDKNRIYKKKVSFTPENCELVPIELVTPIISWERNSLKNFISTLDNVILNENFLYESNDSQGMHINVSFPAAVTTEGKEKFLRLWWHFEPLIFRFIPEKRRNSEYARPLRHTFESIDYLSDNWKDIYADPESRIGKYNAVCVKSNRFEIRIVPSGMNKEHILNWLKLCVNLVFASTTKPIPENSESQTIQSLLASFFSSYVVDKDLETYFLDVVRSYIKPYPTDYTEYSLALLLGVNLPERKTIPFKFALELIKMILKDDKHTYSKNDVMDTRVYLRRVQTVSDIPSIINKDDITSLRLELRNVDWAESFENFVPGKAENIILLDALLDEFEELRTMPFVLKFRDINIINVTFFKNLLQKYPWLNKSASFFSELRLPENFQLEDKSAAVFLKSVIQTFLSANPPTDNFILNIAILLDDYDTVKMYKTYLGKQRLINRYRIFFPINQALLNSMSLKMFKILRSPLQINDLRSIPTWRINLDEAEEIFNELTPELLENKGLASVEFFKFFAKFFGNYKGPCSDFLLKFVQLKNNLDLKELFFNIIDKNEGTFTPCQMLLYDRIEFTAEQELYLQTRLPRKITEG